uniref:Uncharacterized protein n=1 Tax=Meloidogyne enterolobii TaxID=390850 RepID=A0A6V7XXR0_MELEN|nr:unnamed protein product [Meloidogyne enterolobii]
MQINEQLIKSHSSLFVFNLPNYKREYSIIAELIDSNQLKMESVSVNFFANSQFNYVSVLVQLRTLTFSRETPKFTIVVKGQRDQAEKDLKKLCESEDVQAELDLISEEGAKANSGAPSSMKDIYGTKLPWPLVLVLFMMISQQLSGINAAMFYSTAMYF